MGDNILAHSSWKALRGVKEVILVSIVIRREAGLWNVWQMRVGMKRLKEDGIRAETLWFLLECYSVEIQIFKLGA